MDAKVDKKQQIPCLVFPQDMEEGSDEWKSLCHQVRDAMQEYGVFQVVYDKISAELHEEMFKAAKELFDLPQETKMKNTDPRPYYGYARYDPIFESLAIEDANVLKNTQAFTELMWPHRNPEFCQTVNSTTAELYDLELIILKMILESYGLEKYYKSYVESNHSVLRLMRYQTPQSKDSVVAAQAHTDKNVLTIISQLNPVQGLEVQLKGGNWISDVALAGTLTVFVGDSLKAWSNGRIHTAKHRVIMSGDQTRYSIGLFMSPKDDTIIEAPMELIDEEHPQLFRPYKIVEYIGYVLSGVDVEDTLEDFAGI